MAEAGSATSPLAALTLRLIRALEAAGVEYALGGALALGYHAPPRGTKDIDINVFLDADAARAAFDLLRNEGLSIEPTEAVERARQRGDAVAYGGDIRVDIFVNSIPLHDDAARRKVRVRFLDTPTWILSAEDLVVLKLLFNRSKDLVDIEQIVFTQAERFDAAYSRRQLVAHVGEGDERVEKLDKLLARVSRGRPT